MHTQGIMQQQFDLSNVFCYEKIAVVSKGIQSLNAFRSTGKTLTYENLTYNLTIKSLAYSLGLLSNKRR